MKRSIIGGFLMFNGTLICLTIIILAVNYFPKVSEYRGTELWFIIFGATDIDNAQSLYLGIPFSAGIISFFLGFIVLIFEYFSKDKDKL
ncbi:hypothetical protein KHA93_10835 [Bacillus sp. FJAT-49732]|uniref:Uncharacterized protein n=1 Tax=Lederbergia citrisecunda TaxID=2833583 RepID=A0A942TNU7_9BACI|nr:hypothetical protein [Lederbergia citrisecunda]MBS4200127.1 hypothetical protein [Lederbergia citrisecunda]